MTEPLITLNRQASVVYSLPGTDSFALLIDGYGDHSRFHFRPFDNRLSEITLKGSPTETRPAQLTIDLNALEQHHGSHTSKDEHLRMVREALRKITDTDLDKVVISSTFFAEGQVALGAALTSLRDKHPNAFVYAFYHPETGLWMGASPEILVSGTPDEYTTVSLAGTRLYTNEPQPWGQKESLEQSIVTDYIKGKLSESGASDIRISRPETIRYGEIEHLKSILRFRAVNLHQVVQHLHPTPAVCGTPYHTALTTIQELENHKRKWYTGYLGIEKSNSEAAFYVNLRCGQVFSNGILAYSGGGITFDSEPENEWEETREKLHAFLSAFGNFKNLRDNLH